MPRLFATTSRGLEVFLASELRDLGCTDIRITDGKVFFSTVMRMSVQQLRNLRSCERVFALIGMLEPAPKLPSPKTDEIKQQGIKMVELLVCGHPEIPSSHLQWLEAMTVWTSSAPVRTKLRSATTEAPEAKGPKVPTEDVDAAGATALTFRVSCKSRGDVSEGYKAYEFAVAIAESLREQYGWTLNWDNNDLEVFVHLNDSWLLIGLPLFRDQGTLASRTFMSSTGVRSTVAWCMMYAAREYLRPGSVILDPMAGVGATVIEGKLFFAT